MAFVSSFKLPPNFSFPFPSGSCVKIFRDGHQHSYRTAPNNLAFFTHRLWLHYHRLWLGWKRKPTRRCQESRNKDWGIRYSICFSVSVERDESRAALNNRFMDIDKEKAFLSKRRALKGEKIYLDDDLTPAQVTHRKENMPRVLDARKEGKWVVYRDGKVIITEKRTAWWYMAYETLCMIIWNCNGSLWTDVGYFEDTFKNTDIDGSQYVVPNLGHQEALEVREEWLCYTRRTPW